MRRLPLVALALLLSACSTPIASHTTPPPSASIGATPTPSPTATPAPSPTTVNGRQTVSSLDDNGGAVAASILFPPSGSACGSASGKYDSCPVSDALAARLDAHPLPAAEPLCRCQNSWQSRTITTDGLPPGNPGVIAHVVLNFGSGSVKLDVTILRTEAGWFATDTTCSGQDSSATSIYAQSPPPCG